MIDICIASQLVFESKELLILKLKSYELSYDEMVYEMNHI